MGYYNQYLSGLIGSEVRVNRGGPDSETGRLLYVNQDVLALQSSGGVVYFHTQHIKSISGAGSKGNKSGSRGSVVGVIPAYNFTNLLQRLKYQNVRINRGGPEKVEGLVVDVSGDHLTIVVKGELVRVPIFHIKTVAVLSGRGNKSGSQNQNQNQNQNQSRGNKQNQSKSGNNTSGNKTSGGNNTSGSKTSGSKTSGSKSRS